LQHQFFFTVPLIETLVKDRGFFLRVPESRRLETANRRTVQILSFLAGAKVAL
jgi:hypothetical protein